MGIPTPSTPEGVDGLAALLAEPSRAVVALDFDGTLSAIVSDPEQATAYPGAVTALGRLAPLVRSVAVVTGRPAEAAVRHGGFAGAPGLEHLVVLGHYGVERWEAGELYAPGPDAGVAAALVELPGLLDGLGAGPGGPLDGVAVEEKGGRAVAVHTRQVGDGALAAFALLREPLGELARRHDLVVEPGRLVLELRPGGMDKGMALNEHLRAVDGHAVLYAGDDLGDLAAYDAVRRRRDDGGPGVLVCSAAVEDGQPAVPELAAAADVVVDGPAGVVGLLTALADRLTGRDG